MVLHSELAQRMREHDANARKNAGDATGLSLSCVARRLPLFVRLESEAVSPNKNKRKRDGVMAPDMNTVVENGITYMCVPEDSLPPLDQLSFPENHFCAIVLVAPLEQVHPKDHSQLFVEMHRVLRPGGCIFLADRVVENLAGSATTHTGVSSLDHVRRLLKPLNFHIDRLMLHDSGGASGHFILVAKKTA